MVLMFGTKSVTFWYPTSSPPNSYSSTTFQPLPTPIPNPNREGGEERGGSARPSATIASHSRRPRVTVARPSDGPTDPSRWSRGADPALERETNKIIKDLVAAHHGASVVAPGVTPTGGHRSPTGGLK